MSSSVVWHADSSAHATATWLTQSSPPAFPCKASSRKRLPHSSRADEAESSVSSVSSSEIKSCCSAWSSPGGHSLALRRSSSCRWGLLGVERAGCALNCTASSSGCEGAKKSRSAGDSEGANKSSSSLAGGAGCGASTGAPISSSSPSGGASLSLDCLLRCPSTAAQASPQMRCCLSTAGCHWGRGPRQSGGREEGSVGQRNI